MHVSIFKVWLRPQMMSENLHPIFTVAVNSIDVISWCVSSWLFWKLHNKLGIKCGSFGQFWLSDLRSPSQLWQTLAILVKVYIAVSIGWVNCVILFFLQQGQVYAHVQNKRRLSLDMYDTSAQVVYSTMKESTTTSSMYVWHCVYECMHMCVYVCMLSQVSFIC